MYRYLSIESYHPVTQIKLLWRFPKNSLEFNLTTFYWSTDLELNQPLVSIIIVNFSGKILLENCLKSLKNITYKNYEIILVDNNSNDDSVEFVRNNYPEITIIELPKNYGFVRPNNLGAQKAKGQYIFFLNNDTEVTPTFLENLVKVLDNNEKIGICQSLLLKPDNSVDSSGDFINSLGIPFSSKERITNQRKILSAKGAALMIRKNLFEKLGMFDEQFVFSFEDVDLGWRSWIYGYEVVLVPNSIVYHIGGSTIKKVDINIDFHGAKNHLIMKITNFEGKSVIKKIFIFLVLYGLRQIRVWFDYKIKGNTNVTSTKYENRLSKKPNFKEIIKAITWILNNKNYLKKRRDLNSLNRKNSTKILEKMSLIIN